MIIQVLELGGTIACQAVSSTADFYNAPTLSIQALINPLLLSHMKIQVDAFLCKISQELSLENILELARKIQIYVNNPEISGIVITMGTNALEDIAYFIGLVVHTEKPIVFTGAHYPQNHLAFDGKKNLYNAILIASSKEAMRLGVVITFNDYIVSARDATKKTPGMSNNFALEGQGIVGYIKGDQFIKKVMPLYKHTYQSEFCIEKIQDLPKIAIIYAHLNMNDWLIKAAISANISGIISAGFGQGYQSKTISEELFHASKLNIPVVRCARSGTNFSGRDALYDDKYGFIVAKELSPHKASLLLAVALTHSLNFTELLRVFDEY